MKKLFLSILLVSTLLLGVSVEVDGSDPNGVPFGTVTFEVVKGKIDTNLAKQIPAAMNSFMNRIFETVPWDAFFKGFEIRGTIRFDCAKYTLAKCKKLNLKGCMNGGLAGFKAGMIEPVKIIEMVQKPFDFVTLGLGGAATLGDFVKFGIHLAEDADDQGVTYFHQIPFPIMGMIMKAFPLSANLFCFETLGGASSNVVISELDPTAKNSFFQAAIHPELYLVLVPQFYIAGGLPSCIATELLEASQGEHKVPYPKDDKYNDDGYRAVIDALYPINGCVDVKIGGAHVRSDVEHENLESIAVAYFWLWGKLGLLKQTVQSYINNYDGEILCQPKRRHFGYVSTQFLFQLVTPRVSYLSEFFVNAFHFIAKNDGTASGDTAALIWQRRHYIAGAYICPSGKQIGLSKDKYRAY